ncbi:hypothetical protein SAMN04487891_111103 [Flagellimonas taeanensis]|uniref:Uncharacterized protein n=1 Tax=Flagellimonas taeanensis TaxID=1005926 RepID=A0A1M6W8S6_9FLAO|nr:hypothetical protein [Allomuricauda taeanensis]SFC45325.1 hypothetical protein SAMN04487891_111103 [Allomuricauda taeanensis]SHK90164.1 hypothetical protein SAMN05216293_2206 [Allomuricauda taeanensis]
MINHLGKKHKRDNILGYDRAVFHGWVRQWRTELLRYRDKLCFYRQLIGNSSLRISMDDNLDSVREIEISFSEMEQRCDDLLLKTLGHLDQLVRTMENSKNGLSGTFRKEHDDLKDDIDHFVKEFQNIKKDVLIS